jgi:hypothetical protein
MFAIFYFVYNFKEQLLVALTTLGSRNINKMWIEFWAFLDLVMNFKSVSCVLIL